MEEKLIYKCHQCSLPLVPGRNWTLSCPCGFCNLHFNRNGNCISFECYFLKDKKEFCLRRLTFDKEVNLYCGRNFVLSLNIDLEFEDGIPQVERLYNKIKKLVIFK